MRIISLGITECKDVWVGTCRSCNSVAEADTSELTNIVHDVVDGPFSLQKCPVCGAGDSTLRQQVGMIFRKKSSISA